MENKGLLEYQTKGTLTKNFLEDYSHLCKKIYSHWRLRMDISEFYECCVEKLVTRITAFDPARSNIGNYCYNLILNEARRIHSLESHLVSSELEEVLLYQEAPDNSLIQDIWKLAVLAYNKGIYLNQEQLLADYQRGLGKNENVSSPLCTVFCWLRYTGRI